MFPAVFLLYFSIFSPFPLKNKNKIKTCGEVYADSAYANKKNDEKLGQQNNKGFSFTISGYFDIIVGFRILSVVAILALAFA
jgi:hypothetical protein